MRKAFLLRIDADVLDDVQRWADDDLRSLNAQIEFILRRALPIPDDAREQAQERQGGQRRGGDKASNERTARRKRLPKGGVSLRAGSRQLVRTGRRQLGSSQLQ